MLEGLLTVLQTLLGWLFLLIFMLVLKIVEIVESFFDIFAGVQEVYYLGEPEFLFNLFFSNKAVTNMFWAMAIIAVIVSFGLCIVAVARKVTDVAGTSRHTLGQIMSNFFRSLLVILLLNVCIVVAINATGVIFDRINYSMKHAGALGDGVETVYTDEEFATMARILATIGNYSANPSAESRYNVNACFNAIRGEMNTLHKSGCFNYDFPMIQEGKYTWQSALAQVAKAANLNEDLQLDTYYPSVQEAIILCFDQLKTNPNFKPQETAVRQHSAAENMTTAQLIFLASSMGAEENEQFQNGSFEDALRRSYLNGEKSIYSYSDIDEDFAITEINYILGILAALTTILFLGKVVLMFVVRMFNLLLLYVVSPLFASSMALDEGQRFQNWTQSFIMQLLATYGSVVMMRIYLLVIPTVLSSNFSFFDPESASAFFFNIYGQLIVVLAGAWAVSRATSLISGALTGNAAGVIQDADNTFGRTISDAIGWGRVYNEIDRKLHKGKDKKDKKDGNKSNKSGGGSSDSSSGGSSGGDSLGNMERSRQNHQTSNDKFDVDSLPDISQPPKDGDKNNTITDQRDSGRTNQNTDQRDPGRTTQNTEQRDRIKNRLKEKQSN